MPKTPKLFIDEYEPDTKWLVAHAGIVMTARAIMATEPARAKGAGNPSLSISRTTC